MSSPRNVALVTLLAGAMASLLAGCESPAVAPTQKLDSATGTGGQAGLDTGGSVGSGGSSGGAVGGGGTSGTVPFPSSTLTSSSFSTWWNGGVTASTTYSPGGIGT